MPNPTGPLTPAPLSARARVLGPLPHRDCPRALPRARTQEGAEAGWHGGLSRAGQDCAELSGRAAGPSGRQGAAAALDGRRAQPRVRRNAPDGAGLCGPLRGLQVAREELEFEEKRQEAAARAHLSWSGHGASPRFQSGVAAGRAGDPRTGTPRCAARSGVSSRSPCAWGPPLPVFGCLCSRSPGFRD